MKPKRILEALLLLTAAVFLALHALHLKADFPNHSPWMDWSKYTDEGWYGDAAIRHFQRGHWYVPATSTPPPHYPSGPFSSPRLSLHRRRCRPRACPHRSIFALILLTSWLLLRRWQRLAPPSTQTRTPSLAPAIAVLLLAVSPFCFAFTRLAILEPMLILLTLLALLAASYVNAAAGKQLANPPPQQSPHSRPRHSPPPHGPHQDHRHLLLPAIAWLLWARAGYHLRPFLRLSPPSHPRRRPLVRLLRPHRPPSLPQRLPIPLQRQRLHRHHLR